MINVRSWILSLFLCVCALPALAEWEFEENWIDPINRLELRTASSVSDTGVTLNLFRNPIGRVYVLFTLPDDAPDFQQLGVVAEITPRGFDTKEIELRKEPGRFVEYGFSNGRMLRARVWHGQGEAPTVGTLLNVISAQFLEGKFKLADGSTLDAVWSLEGAGLPIAQALGIKIEGIASGPNWEDVASRSLMAAMTNCQFPKLDVICVQKVTDCSTKISEDRDIEAFEVCIGRTEGTE